MIPGRVVDETEADFEFDGQKYAIEVLARHTGSHFNLDGTLYEVRDGLIFTSKRPIDSQAALGKEGKEEAKYHTTMLVRHLAEKARTRENANTLDMEVEVK